MRQRRLLSLVTASALLAAGTTSCAKRYYDEAYGDTKRLELGSVQKEIKVGMTQDLVAIALGTPNIVTNDKEGKETWIYDKIATQVLQSGVSGLILFLGTGADYVARQDISQKTLTVVIKFDRERQVDQVSYHASKF